MRGHPQPAGHPHLSSGRARRGPPSPAIRSATARTTINSLSSPRMTDEQFFILGLISPSKSGRRRISHSCSTRAVSSTNGTRSQKPVGSMDLTSLTPGLLSKSLSPMPNDWALARKILSSFGHAGAQQSSPPALPIAFRPEHASRPSTGTTVSAKI